MKSTKQEIAEEYIRYASDDAIIAECIMRGLTDRFKTDVIDGRV
mgnify:CR=1 FL=1